MFPDMLLITIILRLMFVPLALGKVDMVCLIVAFSIPCWLVALSFKIVWVGTPAWWNNSLSSSISSKILLSSSSNWCPTENFRECLSIPTNAGHLFVSVLYPGLSGVVYTSDTEPVGHSQDGRPTGRDVLLTHGHIYQLLCCGPCIGCPGGAGPPEGMESVLRRVR